jgi:hypothetical protein
MGVADIRYAAVMARTSMLGMASVIRLALCLHDFSKVAKAITMVDAAIIERVCWDLDRIQR